MLFDVSLGSASTASVLPMIGQPSSPGMWVSELRRAA